MPSAVRTSTVIAYRNRLSNRLDHWLFFAVFVIGSSGIVFLRLRDYEQWFVMSFAVASMLVYALYVAATRRYLLRGDQAGDNLYYLGFLYTLVSLGYALLFFSGEEGSTQKIIANFGLALATTIVGLALRVFFNQMREDPVEIEREARMELATAVSRLKAELDTSVIELNSFRRATAQSLSEGMTAVSDKANTVLEEHARSLSGFVEQALEKLEEGFSSLKESQKELDAASRKTVNAVEELARRVENVSVPSDLIERKLSPTLEGLTESARAMAAHAQAQGDSVEKLKALLEGAVASARLLDEGLTALVTQSEGGRQRLETEIDQLRALLESLQVAVRQSLGTMQEGAGAQGQILSKLSGLAEQHLKLAEGHRRALEGELEKSRALVTELHEALISMTNLLIEKLDGR